MKFRLTGEFGELSPVRDNIPHTGIDISMPEGTVLGALRDGVVDRVYDGSTAIGKGISIKFDDGSRAIYGHLSDVSVKAGEHVGAGEIIGFSGNTGNSTGPHLHFAMKDAEGGWLDPTPLGKWFIERGKVGSYEGADVGFWGSLGESLAEMCKEGAIALAHILTEVMPEIGAGITIICAIGIMLTGNVPKWLGRWAVGVGGAILWLLNA